MSIADPSLPQEAVTAALLVIGDEILSGRTKDKNIGYIADYLTAVGIDLCEVRIVGDEESAIVGALNALRVRYTYVFTTGGIGPTHDDITADCVAKAFGVSIDVDPRAWFAACSRLRISPPSTPSRWAGPWSIPSSPRCRRIPGSFFRGTPALPSSRRSGTLDYRNDGARGSQ